MIYEWLCEEARAISSTSQAIPMTAAQWQGTVEQRREMWLEMLGLWPLPERTPLEATVTGTLDRGDYVVEKFHFQSVPGAHVPGNLYRPAHVDGPLPTVLYLCGHTKGKVNVPYQANPRWFGQHGYIALVLDPIQLGESQGTHHGTYHKGRWDWLSRGYTPAGTEVWNAMRALDYLSEREDVDAERMGVTGLSGGGAMSWFLGAADERIKCCVPVCQTGTIDQVVKERATDGHCDCTFWVNYYRWCTADIGALIAPRPLLVAAGTDDILWRPYAFRETMWRISRVYEQLGAVENCELVEDLSPHGYTPKLRKAIFSWFDHHLKGSDEPVTEDITDYVEPEENLLVFGGKLPENDQMARIDEILGAPVKTPQAVDHDQWMDVMIDNFFDLCELPFKHIRCNAEPTLLEARLDGGAKGGSGIYSFRFDPGDGTESWLRLTLPPDREGPVDVLLSAMPMDARTGFGGGPKPPVPEGLGAAVVEVRGSGATQIGPQLEWTVRRAHQLIGSTLPERQVYDLMSGAVLLEQHHAVRGVSFYGKGYTAVLALYAAVLDEPLGELILEDVPETHTAPDTPEFLGILRIGDLPHNLACRAGMPITFIGSMPPAYQFVVDVYEKLGFSDRIRVLDSLADWRPLEISYEFEEPTQ